MEQQNIRKLSSRNWEDLIDYLTSDMDPEDIDVSELADRYRTYIDELEKHDLRVSARAIRILATILNLKMKQLDGENPLQEEEEEVMEEEGDDERELSISLVSKNLDVPVKPEKRRRISKRELKSALRDALEVQQQREQRQEQRQMIEQDFEPERDSVRTRINRLHERVQNMVGSEESVNFDRIVENHDDTETLEKFKHLLTLEGDQRVKCKQDEFLGDLEVIPEDRGEKPDG